MAKSKNGVSDNVQRNTAGDVLAAVGAPLDAPAPQPRGRPRKQSRRGKGGGPKTKAGKAAVSRNAIKHGIYSFHSVVIEGIETVEDWDRFCGGIVEYFAPVGLLEEDLAESIALARWRLRRVTHAETAEINLQVQRTQDQLEVSDMYLAPDKSNVPEPEPMRVAAHQQSRIVPFGETGDRLMRYESHLHRLWKQTLHELEALQARRMGQPAHLTRVDYSSPPAQFGNTSSPKLPEVL